MTAASLCLLGGFDFVIAGRPHPLCRTGERLLGFLAVYARGRPVPRAVVAEQLWSDASPDRVGSRLRSLLWRLPKAEGASLVHGAGAGLALAAEVDVDLWRAEDHAKRVLEPTAPVVGHLFERDLLPDWSEDWLLIERESFRQTRLHALEKLSERLRSAHDYPGALAAGLAAVRGEPLRESAHRQVIAVHLSEGNHAEALRQYHSFRRLLASELGLPPSPSIRGLVAPLLGRPIECRPPRADS